MCTHAHASKYLTPNTQMWTIFFISGTAHNPRFRTPQINEYEPREDNRNIR